MVLMCEILTACFFYVVYDCWVGVEWMTKLVKLVEYQYLALWCHNGMAINLFENKL
jgi:hypothetical protein